MTPIQPSLRRQPISLARRSSSPALPKAWAAQRPSVLPQQAAPELLLSRAPPLSAVEFEVQAAAVDAGHPAPQVLALQADVASEKSVRSAAEAVKRAFSGTLDVLVNNAGYCEEWVPIADSDPASWWRSWEVNVNGTYLCCRFFLPLVLRSETRTIINLTSAGAHLLTYGATAYQTARFAACRFTEFAAREYGDTGLVAVALHPGGLKTDLAMNMPEYMHALLIDELELPADTMVWGSGAKSETGSAAVS